MTIPKPIREELDLDQGDYLVLEPKGDYVVGKKAAVAPTDDFEQLARKIAKRLEDRGITADDVEDAIRWARDES